MTPPSPRPSSMRPLPTPRSNCHRRRTARITCECGRTIEVQITILDSDLHQQLPVPLMTEPQAACTGLSAIERRVLALTAAGNSDREIAGLLGISLHSAKHALRTALVRLSARNRTEAAVRAMAMGLLSGEEVSLADGAGFSR
jgi:DNA-binding CsgD family transcriptional regulator